MESLTNWMVETKPTNKFLAWLLIHILKDGDTINPMEKKWIYKTAIQYLRLPRYEYSQRNHDWFEDCMKIMDAYRKSLKK
jgi:hypothetical protein